MRKDFTFHVLRFTHYLVERQANVGFEIAPANDAIVIYEAGDTGGCPPIPMKTTGDRGRRTAHGRFRSPVSGLPSIFKAGVTGGSPPIPMKIPFVSF